MRIKTDLASSYAIKQFVCSPVIALPIYGEVRFIVFDSWVFSDEIRKIFAAMYNAVNSITRETVLIIALIFSCTIREQGVQN